MRPIFKPNPTTGQIEFVPNPKQEEFLRQTAADTLFAGGTRLGKTVACWIKAIEISYMYENNLGLIGRLHWTHMEDTTWPTGKQILDELGWDYEYKSAKHNIVFPNGSVIILRELDGFQPKQGLNLGWFFIDQLEDVAEETFNVLHTRLSREPKISDRPECAELARIWGQLWQRITFHTCNATEEDHWVYKRWKINEERHKIGHPDWNPRFALIEGKSDDNQENLPADYLEKSFGGLPPAAVQRYRYGKWGGYTGKIFLPLWDDDRHIVKSHEHTFPAKCTHYRSFDHGGMADAGCCLFAYVSANPYDGQMEAVVYDLYWGEKKRPDQHAFDILKMWQEFDFYISYADPQVKDRTQHSSVKQETFSLLDIYREHGLEFVPAFRPKEPGVTKVQQWLMLDPKRPHRFLKDKEGKPLLGAPHVYIVDHCLKLIEQLKNAHMSEAKPGTIANTMDDAVTALRFLLASPLEDSHSGQRSQRIIKDPMVAMIQEDVARRREAREFQDKEDSEESGEYLED